MREKIICGTSREIDISQLSQDIARTKTTPAAGPGSRGPARKQVGAKKMMVPPGRAKKASGPAWLRKAEKEVKKYRATDELLVKKALFQCLLKELAHAASTQGAFPTVGRRLRSANFKKLSNFYANCLRMHRWRRITLSGSQLRRRTWRRPSACQG